MSDFIPPPWRVTPTCIGKVHNYGLPEAPNHLQTPRNTRACTKRPLQIVYDVFRAVW